jgi:hypothetical protein
MSTYKRSNMGNLGQMALTGLTHLTDPKPYGNKPFDGFKTTLNTSKPFDLKTNKQPLSNTDYNGGYNVGKMENDIMSDITKLDNEFKKHQKLFDSNTSPDFTFKPSDPKPEIKLKPTLNLKKDLAVPAVKKSEFNDTGETRATMKQELEQLDLDDWDIPSARNVTTTKKPSVTVKQEPGPKFADRFSEALNKEKRSHSKAVDVEKRKEQESLNQKFQNTMKRAKEANK